MSIRLQLFAVALTTLILPWAGCQYARELESTLRVSQENSLQAAAATIANALSAQPDRVFEEGEGPRFDAARGDLYVFPLHHQPLLDGYPEDWNLPTQAAAQVLPAAGLAARALAGETDRFLFLYLEVDDPTFNPEPGNPHPEADAFDRVNLEILRPEGTLDTYFFATGAPGPIAAQSSVRSADGGDHAVLESRIQAFWRQTTQGYALEARIPKSLLGSSLWISAVDGGGAGRAGTTSAQRPGGRFFRETPGLNALLATFLGPGTRATIIDDNALKLGTAGSLDSGDDAGLQPVRSTWYRRFIAGDTSRWPVQTTAPDRLEGHDVQTALAGRAAAEWRRGAQSQPALLSAAAPIRTGGVIRGAVVLEQAGDQLLDLRDRALTHLFNLTLLGTALAAAIAFGVATGISVRIGRLRLAADGAVTQEGRIRLDMPESRRADEIGALARAFERLLGRLNEHTQYLRTLGGKLSHELRTPLTIVRSSLDNLESEGVRSDQHGYLTRAREGIARLQSILSALGAASRVEESIKQTERVNFDLGALVASAVEGYRDGFPAARIEVELPVGECFLRGAPDLIVQMLDKLVENAVDFCPAAGTITVRLARVRTNYELTVDNDGPPIPAEVQDRLFESLFEHRAGRDDKPHFGLGLYIVRLVAEFHGGKAVAANRAAGGGVAFSVSLPFI